VDLPADRGRGGGGSKVLRNGLEMKEGHNEKARGEDLVHLGGVEKFDVLKRGEDG